MILVLEPDAAEPQVRAVLARMRELGLEGRPVRLGERPFIHVTEGPTPRAQRLLAEGLVAGLVPTSGPRVRREGRRFHPYHSLRLGAWLTLLVGGLFVLAGAFPSGVGVRPMPGQELPAISPWPWYLRPFRVLYTALPEEPGWLGPGALVVLVLGLFCLPWIDRSRGEGWAARLPVVVLAAAGVLFALGAVFLGGRP